MITNEDDHNNDHDDDDDDDVDDFCLSMTNDLKKTQENLKFEKEEGVQIIYLCLPHPRGDRVPYELMPHHLFPSCQHQTLPTF